MRYEFQGFNVCLFWSCTASVRAVQDSSQQLMQGCRLVEVTTQLRLVAGSFRRLAMEASMVT